MLENYLNIKTIENNRFLKKKKKQRIKKKY